MPPDGRLIQAVKKGSLPAARRALLAGADLNAREARLTHPRLETMDRGGKPYLGDTALILAVKSRNPRMVTLLLGKGADANRRGLEGNTPILTAVQWSWTDVLRLLVRYGADVNLHRKGEPTPLEQAEARGNDRMARTLRAVGGKSTPHGRKLAEARYFAPPLRPKIVTLKPRDTVLTAEDRAVIEAAAEAFLRHIPIALEWLGKGSEIYVLDRTAGNRLPVMDDRIDYELTDRQANEVTLEMRKQLVARNGSAVSLAGVAFRNPRLRLYSTRKMASVTTDQAEGRRTRMHISLPAYSPRRDRAVLQFGAGNGSPGVLGTYLLAKHDGQWHIRWRGYWYND